MRILRIRLFTAMTALAMAMVPTAARAGNQVFTNFDGPPDVAKGTTVNGLNNRGQAVGFSTDGVHDHGFLYDTTKSMYTPLADPNVANLLFTPFLGLNNHGEAVGYYQTNDGSQHGFLYDIATGAYTFLDDPNAATSGLSITQITGINDSGEIAGFHVDSAGGNLRGFVAVVSVAEPGSLALLGVGVVMASGFAARRARSSGRARS